MRRSDPTATVQNRWAVVGVIAAVLILVVVSIWLLPQDDRRTGIGAPTMREDPRPVATTGAPDLPLGREGLTTVPVVREIEALTGIDDRRHLIGQRVELDLPREQVPHHVAFWVGERDRVLVVLGRDTRDGAARQRGLGGTHRVDVPAEAQRVRIVGTVERIPHAEGTASWGLSRPEYARLTDQGIYILAHEVIATEIAPARSPHDPGRGATGIAPGAEPGTEGGRPDVASPDARAPGATGNGNARAPSGAAADPP